MAKLIWTEESLESLRRISQYLAELSPHASASVTEGIWNRAQVLSEFPRAGWQHDEIVGRDVRSLLYGHYRIVYELESIEVVRILSVIHTSIDMSRLSF